MNHIEEIIHNHLLSDNFLNGIGMLNMNFVFKVSIQLHKRHHFRIWRLFSVTDISRKNSRQLSALLDHYSVISVSLNRACLVIHTEINEREFHVLFNKHLL